MSKKVNTEKDGKLISLSEALLEIEFQEAAEQYETDPEFRATVQRLSDSIIERNNRMTSVLLKKRLSGQPIIDITIAKRLVAPLARYKTDPVFRAAVDEDWLRYENDVVFRTAVDKDIQKFASIAPGDETQ